MLRSIVSVLTGFVVWTVLWLAGNAAFQAAMPESFGEDGSVESGGLLLSILVFSVVCSLVAGYLTARVAIRKETNHALALGVLQLIVGIFVQLQYWELMPVWYHITFLILLIPGIMVGARLRIK